jgi:hypothetical protein
MQYELLWLMLPMYNEGCIIKSDWLTLKNDKKNCFDYTY